jgi:hypothetical protein
MNYFSTKCVTVLGVIALGVVSLAQAQTTRTAIQALTSPESSRGNSTIESAANPPNVALDPASLLPDLAPIPVAKATLVGGTIEKLDRVQDRLTVQVFGGGKTSALFDGRTQVYRDGQPASLAALKTGDRVYIDTILYNGTVFARSIRLRTSAAQGESQGIILSYRPGRNELVVRDVTAPAPLKLRLTSSTRITNGERPASTNDLVDGTLVSIRFGAEGNGHETAQQISILAAQGAPFTFTGRVVFLDLHNGLLVLTSDANHKTYEIYLNPSVKVDPNLREGADVMAQTRFDRDRYVAQSVTVQSNSEK